MKSYLKKWPKAPKLPFLIFIYALSFSMLLAGINFFKPKRIESPAQIQENIADNIIRLHVIANSDTDNDQALKLKVRDGIIDGLKETIAGTTTVTGAEEMLLAKKTNIQDSAMDIISCNGYSYPVNVSLEERYFPVKSYGDLVFPAGSYKALCVEIGEAKGRNWWCVLFPSLCFVDETYAVVPESSKEKLRETLSEEEYKSLEQNKEEKEEKKFFIHSAIYDWFREKTGL